MLKAVWQFNKGILTLPRPWRAWMGLLVLANMIMPFFFLETPEAQVVLIGVVASMTIMVALFAKLGFVKLLGLGHIPWLFTVPWLVWRLGQVTASGFFFYWLLAVVILDGISLLVDAVDVLRYARGERQPTLTVEV